MGSRPTPAVSVRGATSGDVLDGLHAADAVPVRVHELRASYGPDDAVRAASLEFTTGRITAIIGPSGCGKSTLLRCINRLHETLPYARVRGEVYVGGRNVYADGVNPIAVRRGIGFVAQRPTPFPTMSIRENVVAGLRASGTHAAGSELDDRTEYALQRTGLWEEVRDRLDADPLLLSDGQQQRLCLARALAPAPRVLLLDEPTAALDPGSTQRIEELVYSLRGDVTVVIVTHNMQQAARVSDHTAFMLEGELVEHAPTRTLFTAPRDPRTELYVTGRFG